MAYDTVLADRVRGHVMGEAALSEQRMEMRGGPIQGWLRVPAGEVDSDDELARWVERGVRTARSLPPKTSRR